jgi:hypothetical protein
VHYEFFYYEKLLVRPCGRRGEGSVIAFLLQIERGRLVAILLLIGRGGDGIAFLLQIGKAIIELCTIEILIVC